MTYLSALGAYWNECCTKQPKCSNDKKILKNGAHGFKKVAEKTSEILQGFFSKFLMEGGLNFFQPLRSPSLPKIEAKISPLS